MLTTFDVAAGSFAASAPAGTERASANAEPNMSLFIS
jgi:hypothetical protein